MKIELPKLGFEYNALEPYMDEETIKIHHGKHHQAYTNNFKIAVEKHPELLKLEKAEDLLKNIHEIPEDIQTAVRNHGGGYVNHNLFWTILKKDVPINGKIETAINESFESFEKFKEIFSHAAVTLFGSGWVWLAIDKEGKLQIVKSFNQDNPLSAGMTPIMCLDVWEHTYYLKYQNKRADFVKEFFNIINWDKVNELYLEAKKE